MRITERTVGNITLKKNYKVDKENSITTFCRLKTTVYKLYISPCFK